MLSSAALALSGCAADKPVVTTTQVAPSAVPVEPVQAVATTDAALAERVGRLERNMGGVESDVANLQEEVTAARPRLAKVETMERHFRQLSLELDRINQTYDVAATPVAKPPEAVIPQVKPAPKPAPAPVVKKAEPVKAAPKPKAEPAVKAGTLKVNQVRIGEQPGGKTRIVLDSSQPAKINYDIDNGEKILVIEVPGAGWSAQQSATLKNSPLVSSYTAESDSTGSRIIVQLKADAQVLGTSRLGPANGAGHRVFLDLGKK